MEFEKGGGAFEGALLLVAALGLDFAQLVDSLLVFVEELAAVRLVGGGIFGSEDRGAAGRPWVRAFCEDRCLPAAVRGPVERLGAVGWLLVASGVGIGFVMEDLRCRFSM